jgi:LacI family transcriptional regulator
METWKGDGIIAGIENRRVAQAVAAAGLPAVNLDTSRLIPIPLVDTSQQAVAKLAFGHLVERGITQFGFCGHPRYNWSKARQAHFAELAQQAGFFCDCFSPEPSFDLGKEFKAIAQWLTKLPKPIGIMAAYDTRAHQILDICRNESIIVPDEIAVVGVDNEELLCRLASPPLTSIALNSKRMGYLAATLLDRMMAGEVVPPDVHLVDPVGIICRQSTDILAIKDPLVARAVRFIREHACEGINVHDVLREVPMSRRVLESRFKKLIERSPQEEIVKTRIRRVKELLKETELPLYIIAEKAGFEHIEYLSVAFKREEGVWPSGFRAKSRAEIDPPCGLSSP